MVDDQNKKWVLSYSFSFLKLVVVVRRRRRLVLCPLFYRKNKKTVQNFCADFSVCFHSLFFFSSGSRPTTKPDQKEHYIAYQNQNSLELRIKNV
jgi:hypothetical protein